MTAPGRRLLAAPEAAVVLLVATVVAVGTAWGMRASEGRAALAAADAAAARGDTHEVVVALRTAAEARCPTCAAPEAATLRLDALAKESEARGDLPTARFALAALRGASLTSRLGPSDARASAEREILRLERAADPAVAAQVGRALGDDELPRLPTFLLLTAALALLAAAAARVVGAPRVRVVDAALAAAGIGVGALGVLAF